MTITGSEVYWMTRLDAISVFFGITSTVLGIAILAMTFIFAFALNENGWKDDFVKSLLKIMKMTSIPFLICLIIVIFVPNTKEMIMIKGLPPLINSDYVQNELPSDAKEVKDITIKWLKKKLAEPEDTKTESKSEKK